jgi:hypothetical protein
VGRPLLFQFGAWSRRMLLNEEVACAIGRPHGTEPFSLRDALRHGTESAIASAFAEISAIGCFGARAHAASKR